MSAKKKLSTVFICILCVVAVVIRMFIYCIGALRVDSAIHYKERVALAEALIPGYYLDPHGINQISACDRYGRYIFECTIILHDIGDYQIIVQKVEDNRVYYYPDVAIVRATDRIRLSDEEYEAFKARNDWGKPLNYEKMTWCEID